MKLKALAIAAALGVATPAGADFSKVTIANELKRIFALENPDAPICAIESLACGQISGMGMESDVTGNWSWRYGYFCRKSLVGRERSGV